MNNQFNFSFGTHRSFEDENYSWEGRQYLLCRISRNNCLLLLEEPFTHLLIPNDNSFLANHIRNNPKGGEFFSIPLSDLKFLPKLFKKGDEGMTINKTALLVKDTTQIKKITEKEVNFPQTLAFKVKNQRKFRGKLYATGAYKHYLEIEPFSLGIEGWPEISKITFAFGYGASLESSPETLMKTWLYNHKILEESVGKTFTMKFNWLMKGESNNELLFDSSRQFDLDSFKEKTAEDNSKNPSKPKGESISNNIKLAIIGGILGTLVLIVIIVVYKKNSSKKWKKPT